MNNMIPALLQKSDSRVVYLDMDGVLCDFDGYWTTYFGMTPLQSRQDWAIVWAEWINHRGFERLDILPGAMTIITAALAAKERGHVDSVEILTAAGGRSFTYHQVKDQKLVWLHKHDLIQYIDRVHVVVGSSYKGQTFGAPGRVLIDDKRSNIEDFDKYGGRGVLYHTSQHDEKIIEFVQALEKL